MDQPSLEPSASRYVRVPAFARLAATLSRHEKASALTVAGERRPGLAHGSAGVVKIPAHEKRIMDRSGPLVAIARGVAALGVRQLASPTGRLQYQARRRTRRRGSDGRYRPGAVGYERQH